MRKQLTTASELTPDPKNANRGTPRGRDAVRKSLAKYGAGRSVLVDAAGTIIAGNKTVEAALEKGLPIRVVETDGTELVVVQRTDLDASSKAGRELAIADNRASELGLAWDASVIVDAVKVAGADLADLWSAKELDVVIASLAKQAAHDVNGKRIHYTKKIQLPIYEPRGDKPPISKIINSKRVAELLAEIDAEPSLQDDEREFLRIAAYRHAVISFDEAANYYAHSSAPVQRLMENSALVIVDFDRAVELGYIKMSERILELSGRARADRGEGEGEGEGEDDGN